jgi:hypothetical protein
MPSKIGDKAFYKCTACRRMYFGYIDVFWSRDTNGTWLTTCPDCQEKKRRKFIHEAERVAPRLPFSLN